MLFVIVLFISPLTGLGGNNKGKPSESNTRVMYKTVWIAIPAVSFILLLLISMLYDLYRVQFLMVVVFVGCLSIFFLTLEDIKTSNSDHSTHDLNSFFISVSLKYAMLSTGLMSILLQYLSFSTIASSLLGDVFTLVFVIVAEVSNMSLTRKEQSSVHTHSRSKDLHLVSEKSILRQIASNEDTKSIFSFLLLNTTFMFVQLLYSFRSKSLGLLSDSLHMALDCTSLLLGLIAGVLSKKPPSDQYPFALKALGTLAGFTNGILLLGIVSGIFIEAIGRFFNPVHLHATNELLGVAILGLLVNLVGLFAFDHAGHGHEDGSGHEENMKGIFLHILADTLGSVGVIVSTILIKMTGWPVFDPLASVFIGSLILLSSIPLLKSTMNGLLLKLDDRNHNAVKNALNEVSMTPGITGYTTPRFWPNQAAPLGHTHGHSHSHDAHKHEHNHGHNHEHNHEQEDHHNHEHNHEQEDHHKHEHDGDEFRAKNKLTGYIHIQYIDSENSTIIKKRVEKIFENNGIQAWIQVEPQSSECWCRRAQV
ncbi:putative zinc transporter MSC2 [Nakaseomyces bracarensis]|uniref:Zinc transporter n=1 Tax=Nakaseomyces bracarensis TaxID=273131 RepID=A0ABR4P003_9SACH